MLNKNGCAANTNTASIEVCSFAIQGTPSSRGKKAWCKLEKEIIWRMDRPEAQLQVKYLGRSN
jgi:hypothetical protein